MFTRREFLTSTAAAGAVASVQAAAAAEPTVSRSGSNSRVRIQSLIRREETIVRFPMMNGDNWHLTWAADDRQLTSLNDGAGPSEPPTHFYNSRLLEIIGGPRDARFQDVPGYPMLARPMQTEDDTRYYGLGTLALDERIYQYLFTFKYPLSRNPDRFNLHLAGAKLIYSPDRGKTWCNQDGSTPVTWESWKQRSQETLVFFEEPQGAFSALSILQMGRNYDANRDGYVYVYSPNGNTEGTMNELVMFRVPKRQILDRDSYEYFAGRQGDGSARWVKDIYERGVVHTFPRGWMGPLTPWSWIPSVVYNAPLGLYMMANWGTGYGDDGTWFTKPSYLGVWIAQYPWGPWTQIHEETAWMPGGEAKARAYSPQIAPKWIAADGKSFWLAWTDYQTVTDGAALSRLAQERKALGNPKQWGDDYAVRFSRAQRTDMPYYSFNAQRVDVVIA